MTSFEIKLNIGVAEGGVRNRILPTFQYSMGSSGRHFDKGLGRGSKYIEYDSKKIMDDESMFASTVRRISYAVLFHPICTYPDRGLWG